MVETFFNEKKARFLSLYRPAQNFGNNIIISWLRPFLMKKGIIIEFLPCYNGYYIMPKY